MSGFKDFGAELRKDAGMMRQYGIDGPAAILEACAARFEARLREWELQALTLEEAAEESGFSYSALQKKLSTGELENAGVKGSPRVRRGDLPRKGGQVAREAPEATDIADRILLARLA
jgi:hypothetical protein